MPKVRDQLSAMGLEPMPTVTNFCIVKFPDDPTRNAEKVRAFLADRNIMVRDLVGYGLPDSIRLSLGTEEEMQVTLDAIQAFLNGANA